MSAGTALSTGMWVVDEKRLLTSIDLVIPVHNEEKGLEESVRHLDGYLRTLPHSTTITIADNASTDGTWEIAARLAAEITGSRLARGSRIERGR